MLVCPRGVPAAHPGTGVGASFDRAVFVVFHGCWCILRPSSFCCFPRVLVHPSTEQFLLFSTMTRESLSYPHVSADSVSSVFGASGACVGAGMPVPHRRFCLALLSALGFSVRSRYSRMPRVSAPEETTRFSESRRSLWQVSAKKCKTGTNTWHRATRATGHANAGKSCPCEA
jgi:hypothetical protein